MPSRGLVVRLTKPVGTDPETMGTGPDLFPTGPNSKFEFEFKKK
jgi:hypothetical protein